LKLNTIGCSLLAFAVAETQGMVGPDRIPYPSLSDTASIVPGRRIVYSDRFADQRGNVLPVTYYEMSRDIPR